MAPSSSKPPATTTTITVTAVALIALSLTLPTIYTLISSLKQRNQIENNDDDNKPNNDDGTISKPSSSSTAAAATENHSFLTMAQHQEQKNGKTFLEMVHAASKSLNMDLDMDMDDLTQHLPPHILREQEKERRRKEKMKHLSMKSPMYDNVQMLCPAGELLSKISARKGRWYVKKELADWTNDEQTCIQLRFEPKARSIQSQPKSKSISNGTANNHSSNSSEDDGAGDPHSYSISDKLNICVSCGDEQHHTRHYIVPYVYRRLLPDRYKSHLSHDIVVLCANCRVPCEQQCQKRMKEIEEECRVRQDSDGDEYGQERRQFENDPKLKKVRSSALALLNWRANIPMEKIRYHDAIVRSHLRDREGVLHLKEEGEGDGSDLTPELLQMAIDVECRVENPNFIPGPELVVQMMKGDEEILEGFVKGWRIHFLETVHPRYMPKGWSVDNPVVSDTT